MKGRPDAAIVGHQVSVAYGGRMALNDASFTVPSGTVTAVVGPNGSGKSTLLSVIAGLIGTSSGELRVLGRAPGSKQLITRVAYVLQSTPGNQNLPITVREVVTIGTFAARGPFRRLTKDDRRAVESAMDQLEITDLASRHLRELSGGQRQRVLIAQGLAQQADVLLLDEPTTGLDFASARRIFDAINGLRTRGRTILLATHDLSDAQRCDEAILLSGRVVAQGRPDAVITTPNLRAAYGGRLRTGADDVSAVDVDSTVHHDSREGSTWAR